MIRWAVTCVCLVAVSLLWLLPGVARADVNNFIIEKFDGNYRLTAEDPQGKLYVKETMDVVFYDYNHGILRAIPEKYDGQKLNLNIERVAKADGSDWPYTTYKENDNLVLKIGDPNATVTGKNRFVIEYSVENVVRFFDSYDELYWDINGDGWLQPFTNVSATFTFPESTQVLQKACFTGSFGSSSQDCEISENGNSLTAVTTRELGSYETLTVATGFSQGVFTAPTWIDTVRDNLWLMVLFVLPIIAIAIPAYRKWYKEGKDLPGRGVIVPEYEVPMNLTPLEVGAIVDYNPDNRDISATIIDLAIRGYIRIDQLQVKKKLRKDQTKYSFTLMKNDTSALKEHEVEILKGIFGASLELNKNVAMSELVNSFYKTAAKVRSQVLNDLTAKKFFHKNPASAQSVMVSVGFVIAFLGFFAGAIFSWGLGLGLVVSGLVVASLGFLMPKRLEAGVRAKEQIEGLKLYLSTAEADRMKMMQGPKARYAVDVNEPQRTLKLFEKLLPAAILLGVEKEWAGQFKDVYQTPPYWYNSSTGMKGFTAAALVSDLSSSVSAMGTSFAAPSSSGGSGSGGGGFSGGGGGGGGGGGW